MNQVAPDGGPIAADRGALETASSVFEDHAQMFANSTEPLGSAHDGIVAGAGEFSAEVSTGAAQFLLGWNEALDVCRETSAIIAGNIGNYWIDLSAMDTDYAVDIDLTSSAG